MCRVGISSRDLMNMQNRWLQFLIIGFLAIATILFYWIRLRPIDLTPRNSVEQALNITEPTITYINPTKGAKEATVTIVEFSDFQCQYCQTIQPALDAVLRSYPDQVRLVWKDLPNLSAHPESIPSAIAAHCADRQGKFWEYHDALFTRQSILSSDSYKQIAQDLKLDTNRFTACFANQDTLPIIEKDAAEGRALGILATPTLLIGSQKLVGAVEAEELIQLIKAALPQP